MLKVGLTGGIGSGKSTVASHFAALGVPVVDADVVARQLTEPGSDGLAAVIEAFGSSYLAADGTLDRAALRQTIFQWPEARRRLEAILHPRIRAEMDRQISEFNAPYVLLCIPLLLEKGLEEHVDRVLVVDLDRESQIQRVMLRDGCDREAVEAILATQADRVTRLSAADDVLANTAEPGALIGQVAQLHQHYLQLAT